MLKGKYVNRSTYQKVMEENKRLKRQIRILCLEPGVNAIKLRMELRDKFKREDGMNQAINDVLKVVARKFFKDHPELDVMRCETQEEFVTKFKRICGIAFKKGDGFKDYKSKEGRIVVELAREKLGYKDTTYAGDIYVRLAKTYKEVHGKKKV